MNGKGRKKTEIKALLICLLSPGIGARYGGSKVLYILLGAIDIILYYCYFRFGIFQTITFDPKDEYGGGGSFPVILYFFLCMTYVLTLIRHHNFHCKIEIEDLERKKMHIIIDKTRKAEWGKSLAK